MSRYLAMMVVVLCAASGFAGDSHTVGVGSRVRVTAQEGGAQPLIGTVVGLEPHAVLVRSGSGGAATRIPLGPTTTFEVSGGRRSKAGRGAMVGAAVGGMPGLLLTFGDYNSDDHSPGAVAALGAAAGAAVGAAVGWALKSEDWFSAEPPSVTAGIAPLRGGVGFSVHIAWGKGPPKSRD